jgi:hypothetical protein
MLLVIFYIKIMGMEKERMQDFQCQVVNASQIHENSKWKSDVCGTLGV